jgi:D-alanyl-D-alanine carboxypeptidase
MAKKHLRITALSLGLFGVLLFPSVTNITPARAIDLTTNSIDAPQSLWVVVNKTRPLSPAKYSPQDLITPKFGSLNANPYSRKLRQDAGLAAIELAKALNAAGKGKLVIQSAYRSYSEQKSIHDRQVDRYGLKVGEALAARPGFSEHQTGLAMDVSARSQGCQIRVCFGGTKAGSWLAANAYKYGWIVRYPSYATKITGYQYEPWHLRFVGIELATDMHEKKIHTLEQYFKLPAAPNYP